MTHGSFMFVNTLLFGDYNYKSVFTFFKIVGDQRINTRHITRKPKSWIIWSYYTTCTLYPFSIFIDLWN